MKYSISDGKLLDAPDWTALHQAADLYEKRAAEETFALILRAFYMVHVLESITFTVRTDPIGAGLRPLGFSCTCEVALRAVPARLVLPQLDPRAGLTDVVALFVQRANNGSEAEFASSLGNWFEEVWPAFNDRAHLFGGVGRFTVSRNQVAPLLGAGSIVDLEQAMRVLTDPPASRALSYSSALVERPAQWMDTVSGWHGSASAPPN